MRNERLDKQTLRVVISAVLVFLIMLFIFSNSMQNGEQSNVRSGQILKLLQKVLDPQGRIPEAHLHWFVRKLAHFTEFVMLGAALWWLLRNIRSKYGVYFPLGSPFCALLTAVTDEYIQSFTGRTSSVQDVLIDFCGAVFGILLLTTIAVIMVRKRRSRRKIC